MLINISPKNPHPPPDLPLARGAKRLRSAKGEESREARDDFPPLQGEGQGGGGVRVRNRKGSKMKSNV